MNDFLEIDGSMGEGGGQVFRSSLSLSMVTGQPIRVGNIRAGRKKPGLMRQHLTALTAAAEICGAEVQGAEVGQTEVSFRPGPVRSGDYAFSIGTAGSTTLVLQALLPALWVADGPSTLRLEGGTHNPHAPPFDFLKRSFLPLVERMGPRVSVELERLGFFPAGGGRISVQVEPASELLPLELLEAGPIRSRRARVLVSDLPSHIGEREVREASKRLSWTAEEIHLEEISSGSGPGNVVLLEVERDSATEIVTGFGQFGVRAEAVVARATKALQRYLKAEVPVGVHLADQILLPLAMAGSGSFLTLPLSRHASTQIELLRKFFELEIEVERLSSAQWRVTLAPPVSSRS